MSTGSTTAISDLFFVIQLLFLHIDKWREKFPFEACERNPFLCFGSFGLNR